MTQTSNQTIPLWGERIERDKLIFINSKSWLQPCFLRLLIVNKHYEIKINSRDN